MNKKENNNFKSKVEDIFQSPLVSCMFDRDFVLSVEFEENTDVGIALERCPYTKKLRSSELFELSQEVPVVVFNKARLERYPNAPISNTRSLDNILQQDPLHYDFLGVDKGDTSEKATFLYNPNDISREALTYFALPDAVKLTIPEMKPLNVSNNVLKALKQMSQNNFNFSLESKENEARKILKSEYPTFTDDLIAQMPKESTFSHQWKEGDSIVTMHNNNGKDILHGRGASQTDNKNYISVCDFYLG